MLGAQVITCWHLSCHCWKPCHHICLFLWYYTYTFANWQWIFTGATHISKHTSYFKACHSSSRPSIFKLTHVLMVSTHSCTMTQSTCANYMLKSAVPWYYFMSDMLSYFLKLPCVPVRGRKLKIWYKEHIHNRDTTEMNKDVPLIVNNNHAIGVIMLTLLNYTYFSFLDWSTFWNQTTKTPTGFHTDPHHTKLEGYRHLQLHRLLQNHHIPSIMT